MSNLFKNAQYVKHKRSQIKWLIHTQWLNYTY